MITIILIVLCVVFAPVLVYLLAIGIMLPVIAILAPLNWVLESFVKAGNLLEKLIDDSRKKMRV